jgi:hypothetical protein
MNRNPLTTGAAHKFVPDMAQSNYRTLGGVYVHKLRGYGGTGFIVRPSQRATVQDSLNRKADR